MYYMLYLLLVFELVSRNSTNSSLATFAAESRTANYGRHKPPGRQGEKKTPGEIGLIEGVLQPFQEVQFFLGKLFT